jgi:hypothetical protein
MVLPLTWPLKVHAPSGSLGARLNRIEPFFWTAATPNPVTTISGPQPPGITTVASPVRVLSCCPVMVIVPEPVETPLLGGRRGYVVAPEHVRVLVGATRVAARGKGDNRGKHERALRSTLRDDRCVCALLFGVDESASGDSGSGHDCLSGTGANTTSGSTRLRPTAWSATTAAHDIQ